MKTLLLSALALTVAAAPMFGEEQDQLKKPPKQVAPPPRHVNTVPRSYTPRIQQQLQTKTQAVQNRQNFNRRNTTKTFTPNVQTRTYTPNQNTTVNANTNATNQNWNRYRNRTNTKVMTNPLNTTTQANTNTTVRNRNWQNRTNTNTTRTFTYDQARRNFSRERHDRGWWRSRYNRIVLFGGGYYYWNDGYWYPAYGYDPYYSTYAYDEPIYGYNDLAPGQVIANVQTALQEQGYYRDAVDGLIGPNTRAALSAYQRDHGLPITAAIDGPTLQSLGLA
jgi:peptidoglycan hydrolase-like protein with peptidoglycan-binding domain